jgi:hypothetical protein
MTTACASLLYIDRSCLVPIHQLQGRRNWGGRRGSRPRCPLPVGAKVPFQFKGLPLRNSELSEMLVQFFYEFASENARNAVIELQEYHNRLAENPLTPLSSNK